MSWHLIAFSLVPMVVMAIAGVAAAYIQPGPKLRSGVLHLAAGVIFAVVAVEFLPDLMHRHAGVQTVFGFVLGTATMLFIRSWSRRAQGKTAEPGRSVLPVALLFAIGVDLAIDGLMLGIAFAAGNKAGMLLSVALAIELCALGLATAASLVNDGVGRARSIGLVAGLSLLFGVCALAASAVVQYIPGHDLAAMLAFGSAALLFLVTEELLTEAHETEESPWLTGAFFLGFIALFMVDMLSQ